MHILLFLHTCKYCTSGFAMSGATTMGKEKLPEFSTEPVENVARFEHDPFSLGPAHFGDVKMFCQRIQVSVEFLQTHRYTQIHVLYISMKKLQRQYTGANLNKLL